MTNMELLDEPINVTATVDTHGHLTPQNVRWREHKYTIVTVGRQWDEDSGRSVLTEAADGTRFELQLRREDLTWRMRKVWWGPLVA